MDTRMDRLRIAPTYESKWIEDRPTPLSDSTLDNMVADVVIGGKMTMVNSDTIAAEFIKQLETWILGSTLNKFTGLETFAHKDVCAGCTQFIDNLYMQGPIQVLHGDYRYHERLKLAMIKDVGSLIPNIPLILSMPFPRIGAVHIDMEEILDECLKKNIPVHIDGAWVTCCRSIDFNFNSPAIRSVCISLSKGLGLGWNRVAVRWSREKPTDSIAIMNDFNMLNKITLGVGSYYMSICKPDYLWKVHGDSYYKVCNDFNLKPTNSIHLALDQNNMPRGISPLIRFLDN